jgi:hypothetical protein
MYWTLVKEGKNSFLTVQKNEGTIGQQVNTSPFLFITLYSRVFFTPPWECGPFVVSIPTAPTKSPVESVTLITRGTRFLGFRRGVHPKEYTPCVQDHVAGQCTHPCESELFLENRSWSNNRGAFTQRLSHWGGISPPPSLASRVLSEFLQSRGTTGGRGVKFRSVRRHQWQLVNIGRNSRTGIISISTARCGKLSQCHQEDSPLLSSKLLSSTGYSFMGETPLAVNLLPLFRKALANRGMMTNSRNRLLK